MKEEVMDWIITYQDVRRNMCEAEKIYANDKVSMRRIKEENEKRLSEAGKIGASITNNPKSGCVHLDAGRKIEQRAKIAGVSAGTVARFNKVMKLWNGCLIFS